MSRRLKVLHLVNGSDAGGLSRYVLDLSVALKAAGHAVGVVGERGVAQAGFDEAGIEWVDVPFNSRRFAAFSGVPAVRDWVVRHGGVDVLHTHYRRPTWTARFIQRLFPKAARGSGDGASGGAAGVGAEVGGSGGTERARGNSAGNARMPVVLYTLHLSDLPMGFLSRRLSDWGDHTHVASSEAAAWMEKVAGVPAERVSVIPHGVDVRKWPVTTRGARERARKELGFGNKDLVAAYVGRLDQNHPKNAHWALEVIRRLSSAPLLAGAGHPDAAGVGAGTSGVGREALASDGLVGASVVGTRSIVSGVIGGDAIAGAKLVIAGDGPDRARIEGLVREWGLSDRVKLLGETDPRPVYAAADLLLLPSGREGFSLVTAEAMVTGLPVVRTRTAGTRELLVEGQGELDTGVSTPVEEEAFVTAALALLQDETRLRAMRSAGPKHIREGLTFERQVKETVALYERLLG